MSDFIQFRFGKYRGMNIKDCCDLSYLNWSWENMRSTPGTMRAVHDRIRELKKIDSDNAEFEALHLK